MIKEVKGLFFVYNKEGTKPLSKGYATKEEAEKRLREIETFKHQDSNSFSKIDFELNDDTLVIYNVPIAAEIVQRYDDGMAYKPYDVIKKIDVDQVPLTMLDYEPDHPDRHLNVMETNQKAHTVVGFMTEPSKPKMEDNKKRYADFVIYRTPKTKSLVTDVINGESVDTSIGFIFEPLHIKGSFNGMGYDYIQSEIQLDHNAILIDSLGNKGVGRLPNPMGGIGADSNDKTKNKNEVDKMSDEIKKELDSVNSKNKELVGTLEQKDKALKENNDKIELLEKQIASDSELKVKNDALTKELETYRAERKSRVDSIKEKLKSRNPLMKEIIDSANDELLIKMEKEVNDSLPATHISARINGNDKNNKKVNDKAVENYFKN